MVFHQPPEYFCGLGEVPVRGNAGSEQKLSAIQLGVEADCFRKLLSRVRGISKVVVRKTKGVVEFRILLEPRLDGQQEAPGDTVAFRSEQRRREQHIILARFRSQ